MRPGTCQNGVILITTLLMLMTLSLITMVYMQQARHQVSLARGLQHKIQSCQTARNHFDQILTILLTNQRAELAGRPAGQVSGNADDKGTWNYHQQPFEFHGSQVRLQDMAGLVSIDALHTPVARALLESAGVSAAQLNTFLQSLKDWEDSDDLYRLEGAERDWYRQQGRPGPRNAPIASLTELKLVRGYPAELDSLIDQGLITLSPASFINPLSAPEPILAALTNNSTLAHTLAERRKTSGLKANEFRAATGISQTEFILMAPSLRIRLEVTAGTPIARCTERWIADLRGNSRDSFTLAADY